MKNKKSIIAIIVLIIVVGGGFYYFTQVRKAPDLSGTYEVYNVTNGDVFNKITATGTVTAKEQLPLYIETTQTVGRVLVKEGDKVNVSDVLIEYDIAQTRKDLERKLQQAQINLNNIKLTQQTIEQPAEGNELLQYTSAITDAEKNIVDTNSEISRIDIKISQQQSKVDDDKKTLDRNQILFNDGALSKNEYEGAVLAHKISSETLDELLLQKQSALQTLTTMETHKTDAETKLSNATNKMSEEQNVIKFQQQNNNAKLIQLDIETTKDQLSKLTEQTVSPINGSVVTVTVEEGSVASMANAVIKLDDLSAILVKADITEYDAPLMEIGQKVNISTSGLPDKIYEGTITKISANAVEIEKSSGKETVVPIEITVDNNDEKLKAGYSVDIEVISESAKNVLFVPSSAIVYENNLKYVYTFNDGATSKVEVITGLQGDKLAEIKEGLNIDDKVILNPSQINN